MRFLLFAAVFVAVLVPAAARAASWTPKQQRQTLAACLFSPTGASMYNRETYCPCIVPYLVAHTTPDAGWFLPPGGPMAFEQPLMAALLFVRRDGYQVHRPAAVHAIIRCGGFVPS